PTDRRQQPCTRQAGRAAPRRCTAPRPEASARSRRSRRCLIVAGQFLQLREQGRHAGLSRIVNTPLIFRLFRGGRWWGRRLLTVLPTRQLRARALALQRVHDLLPIIEIIRRRRGRQLVNGGLCLDDRGLGFDFEQLGEIHVDERLRPGAFSACFVCFVLFVLFVFFVFFVLFVVFVVLFFLDRGALEVLPALLREHGRIAAIRRRIRFRFAQERRQHAAARWWRRDRDGWRE